MSASPNPLASPPPRPPPEDRVQTRSDGPASSPCALCSPPPRESSLRSPLDDRVVAVEDPIALVVEAWCSPTLVSPAGRPCSVKQLEEKQAAGPIELGNPFLEDEQWDMEAMVLSTIAGQLEDEEEEETEEEVPDLVEKGACDECDDDNPFGGWALGFRGAARCCESSGENGCAAAHSSTGSGAVLAVAGAPASHVKSDSSRLPTSGTAQERKEQHFQMASEQGHATFACRCHIARARGAASCLDRFGKEQFRRWHNETYGVTADGSEAKHLSPATSIHNRMWALKEPLAGRKGQAGEYDEYGRKWQIKNWKLDGQEVRFNIRRQECLLMLLIGAFLLMLLTL
jgi:hypothetical protein